MSPAGREHVEPASRAEWREWLAANQDATGVWLVLRKPSSGLPSLSYDDAVEEALCFGWIDSQAASVDEHRSKMTMTPRRRGSGWSRSNKERLERLGAAGRLAPAGIEMIEAAKADGSWTLLDGPEALIVPDDLAAALAANPDAAKHYEAFPPSARKAILTWIATAKRGETRAKRIGETVRLAAENRRANQ